MNVLPPIEHPVTFRHGTHLLRIHTHFALTDAEAQLIASFAAKQIRRWPASARTSPIHLGWAGDLAALQMLQAQADAAARLVATLPRVEVGRSRQSGRR